MTEASTSNPPANPLRPPTSQYPQSSAQIDNILTEIYHLRDTMTDTVQNPNKIANASPTFPRKSGKNNEFEHLLLNHLRPHHHKLSEEQKLANFQSLLGDDVIEFWQSLKITNQTLLAQVSRYFKEEYAKEDLKELAKYNFDQMRYNPSTETFNDLTIS